MSLAMPRPTADQSRTSQQTVLVNYMNRLICEKRRKKGAPHESEVLFYKAY